jgi:transcription elongation factor Elf1
MGDWKPAVECPKCGSTDTRFVEPLDDLSVYECNLCGCRFETAEEE